MRYFIIYFAWLGTWAISALYYDVKDTALLNAINMGLNELDTLSYVKEKTKVLLEASRTMVYIVPALFLYLAMDKKEKTISYSIQLQHILFIVSAKAIEHIFSLLNVMGYESVITAYDYNAANYLLAAGYFIITPIRIFILKRKAFWQK